MLYLNTRFLVAQTLCLALVALVGCSSRPEPPPPAEVHLKALAVFFGRYLGQHRGQSPRDEKELKEFINTMPADDLKSLGVESVDAVFVSPRDNQPYVVKYGEPVGMPGPQGFPVVAHEQTGVGGKRYVAFAMGDVQLVDEERFKQLSSQ